ncbi:MAG: hypothetical protein U0736_15920 [Gemmataceae bacterium]
MLARLTGGKGELLLRVRPGAARGRRAGDRAGVSGVEEDGVRTALQPWVDGDGEAPAGDAPVAVEASPADPASHYLEQLRQRWASCVSWG